MDELSDAVLWRLNTLLSGTNETGAARTMAQGRTTPARELHARSGHKPAALAPGMA